MDATVSRSHLEGRVAVPYSKSELHRAIIAAMLTPERVSIKVDVLGDDVYATIRCAEALGAVSTSDGEIVAAQPERYPDHVELDCDLSGTTLRFFVPLVAALGISATIHMGEGLARRPHEPLLALLRDHGCAATLEGNTIEITGQLEPGTFEVPSNISSQYISGLLLATPLLNGDSVISFEAPLESYGYVNMTLDILERAGISFEESDNAFTVFGNQTYHLPSSPRIGGDWSSAAFWLVADALGANVHLTNLDEATYQPDAGIRLIFELFGARIFEDEVTYAVPDALDEAIIDCSQTPDLVPALAVLASAARGQTSFTNAARLRLKESDRIASTAAMLRAVGVRVTELEDGFAVYGPAELQGGVIDAQGDHRIAMAAAILATRSDAPITILGAECVAKSYPTFWEDFQALGGTVELSGEEESR